LKEVNWKTGDDIVVKSISLMTLITGIFMVFGLSACSSAYKGPPSDHFDGNRFFMAGTDHGFGDMIKWLWEMETVEWPDWIDDPVQPSPPPSVGMGELKATYVNHATVLLQLDGLNILTDPVWSEKAGPFSWLGIKRVRKPGVSIADLPRIDLVLISHDHYDHLDLHSLKSIVQRDQPIVLTGLGLKSYLDRHGITTVHEMDWWQLFDLKSRNITVTFVPARHNSGRWPLMANKTLWGGYVISGESGNIYFAGDTGYGDFIDQLGSRFKRFRLTILPIGSYEKRWFMKNQHMNPEDTVKTHLVLNSGQSMGIHYATFAEHPEQAIDAHETELADALSRYDVPHAQFWILGVGEGRYVAANR
jgi:L-ascorbate metabolism protein UlaG (beta-lactamase superfamily)